MNYWLILLCLLIPVAFLVHSYIRRKYSYWSSLGVQGPKPSLWTFGNVLKIYGANPSMAELELLSQYGKVYGNYTGLEPTLTVIDAELIKQVLVKDFPSFINRRVVKAYHEFVNTNQFFSRGTQWKRMRTLSGPTFTSGKLRGMHQLMDRCVDKLSVYLDKLVSQEDGLLNTKEVIAGFTIDVIASTSFATETNANGDRTKQNPLVRNGLAMFENLPIRSLSYFCMPRWFNNLINVQHFFNVKAFNFFADLTKEIVRQRMSGSVSKRNDFVQLLVDSYAFESELNDDGYDQLVANVDNDDSKEPKESLSRPQNKNKTKLTDQEIISQCIVYFVAGFETTAVSITNAMFELAQNQDVQGRLCEELEGALQGMDAHSDCYYDTVMNQIPYLDAVIKETLRKYPPVLRLERSCAESEYKIAGIPLYKDQLIEIPVYAVHHNAEYYPRPDQFDPERFMPSNKHLLVPYTYLPFGAGPRNCIGMRFAYQEIKLCLAKIIPQFRVTAAARTPANLQFQSFKPTLNVVPFQLKVDRR